MANYNSLTFDDYPPTEILGKDFYVNSHKTLSFQYRTKDGDKLIAYIALKKEQADVEIPYVSNLSNGCKILKIWVEPIVATNGYVVDNAALRIALLDKAKFYINGWVNTQTTEFEFDYLWFYDADIENKEIIDEIGGMTLINNIYYKVFDRPKVTH